VLSIDDRLVARHLRNRNLNATEASSPNPYIQPFQLQPRNNIWVVNLDKRQTPSKGHWGKLGEYLFDGSPDTLVPLLKQPFDADPHATNSDSARNLGPEIVLFVLATTTKIFQIEC
jgi:hypothetical protein